MSDQTESIPNPRALDETRGFRETFLHRFTDPKDREALERVAAILFAYWGEFNPHMPDLPESALRAEFRAALEDLSYLATFLRELVGFEPRYSEIDEEDRALAVLAVEVANQLAALREKMAALLDPSDRRG